LLHRVWSLGEPVGFGVEGTGSFGAGLARFLRGEGERVVEVNRPNRQARRRNGKSDPVDADAAARAVLSGDADVTPKHADGAVEMIRVLRVARASAVKATSETVNAIHAIVLTAPDELRARFAGLSKSRLAREAAGLPEVTVAGVVSAAQAALRSLGRRWEALRGEIKQFDRELTRLTAHAAPELTARFGVGPEVAAALLTAAGDNPSRLRSEAAFANLTGAAPIQASSGKVVRHRLNRGGNRQANAALHRIAVVRIRFGHPPTVAYMARRQTEGKTKRETIRCLKRYIAREVYPDLLRARTVPPPLPGTA
jgi:transposase